MQILQVCIQVEQALVVRVFFTEMESVYYSAAYFSSFGPFIKVGRMMDVTIFSDFFMPRHTQLYISKIMAFL